MDTPPGTFWQSFLTKPLETIFGCSGIGQLIIYTLRILRFPFIYKSQKRTRQGARGVDQVMEAFFEEKLQCFIGGARHIHNVFDSFFLEGK